MATLSEKDYVRKLRQGKEEVYISLTKTFCKKNNLFVGDHIDLRNLKKTKKK